MTANCRHPPDGRHCRIPTVGNFVLRAERNREVNILSLSYSLMNVKLEEEEGTP